MSHRPYIKNDDSGNISDLAIDAETLQGYKPCVNIVTLEDNNSTKAGTWLAKTNKVSALVDGQLFLYKITVAGASTTTLNITGSGGALGAKTVYRTGTTKLTTQYAVGHYILLAYNSLNTCFRLVNDYDANSYAYVRQYQHGQNASGATNLYPILTRYNLTNKNGKYDNAYARFYTDTYINMTNGYLYAPKVYSGGSEVAVKTDIPTETTISSWGFTKNTGTVTRVDSISPSSGNVSLSAVRYVRQSLTDDQKSQARSNIGAGTSSFTGYTEDNKLRPSCVNYPWIRLLTPTILTGSPYVRITDITYSGTYRLSSGDTGYLPSAVYLRYNGATNNDYITILTNGPGVMDHPLDIAILNVHVEKIGTSTKWTWSLICSDGFFIGETSSSSGSYKKLDEDSVRYVSQSLTDAQKSQARANIGAGTSSLAIGTTASTAAAGNHTHSTSLTTDSDTATVTMAPNTTYKLSTGGTNVVFKTPSSAYEILESLRKGSEADTAVGYYKIATINHASWNFCDFCMLVKNSYAGTTYSTIFNCSCSDSNVTLKDFNLEIISGTDISNKLAYLYTYDSNNNLIKVEVFIHATRFEHPTIYIINARPGQQLVIPTEDEFNKATPDKPDGTTMTGYANPDNRRLLNHELGVTIKDTTTDEGWQMFNPTYMGYLLQSVRFNANSPAWGVGNYGAGIIFGGADTKGVISTGYGSPLIKFASGNGNGPQWWIGLTGTSGKSYNLDNLKYAPTNAGTSGYSLKSNGSGAPRWANEAAVQVSGTISAGAKNNASITLVIDNASKPLKKGVWRYSGTYGVFLIFATTEITTMGSPRDEYICGYVSKSIPNNTSITLVEV